MDQRRVQATESRADKQTGADAYDLGRMQPGGEDSRKILGDRGGHREGNVDSAGDQHDKEAERDYGLNRIALEEVDEVGKCEEAWRHGSQEGADEENNHEQPGFWPALNPAQQTIVAKHRSAPPARARGSDLALLPRRYGRRACAELGHRLRRSPK